MDRYEEEYQEFLHQASGEIDRIKESKEKLRIALVKEGFDIPEGLKLIEWIPYIERGCGYECTISD